MEIADFSQDQKLVLVAMCMQIVDADGTRSPEELNELIELSDEMGDADFEGAVSTAVNRFQSADDVLSFAAGVEGDHARELILTCLVDLATTDGIDNTEKALIDKLRNDWAS